MVEMSYQREANVLGADYFERQGWHSPKEKMTKEDLKHIFLKSVMDLRNKDLLEQDSLLDVFEDVIEPYISELKQQIEKMKCCGNCSHFKFNDRGLHPVMVCDLACPNICEDFGKWEIENE